MTVATPGQITPAMPPDPMPAPDALYVAPVAARRRGSGLFWTMAVLAFGLGLAAMYYAQPLIDRWRSTAGPAEQAQPAATSADPRMALSAVPVTLDAIATRGVALDIQLRAIEQRAADADATSRTAAGNAARSEGMMVAFAARRAIDRGLPLGYLDNELGARFGASEPQAVAIVRGAAREPVTRENLRIALDALSPRLTIGSIDDGVWKTVRNEIANLIVLRRATTPSPRPTDRLTRARRMLDADNVEAALAEVGRLPGASAAASWIEAAKRYTRVRRALNTLEVAAISGRAAPTVAPVAILPPVIAPIGPAPAPTVGAPTNGAPTAAPTPTNPAGQLPGG